MSAADCDRKIDYASRQDAERAAENYRVAFGTRQRAYECPWCGRWHLTTKKADPSHREAR